jgi:hypothetical protein
MNPPPVRPAALSISNDMDINAIYEFDPHN